MSSVDSAISWFAFLRHAAPNSLLHPTRYAGFAALIGGRTFHARRFTVRLSVADRVAPNTRTVRAPATGRCRLLSFLVDVSGSWRIAATAGSAGGRMRSVGWGVCLER